MNKRYLVTIHTKIKYINEHSSEVEAKKYAKEMFELSARNSGNKATVTEFSYCEVVEIPKE